MRVAIATRSLNEYLYNASGELLRLEELSASLGAPIQRQRFTGTDNVDYFRQLLEVDADWVVNIDEDAFLLSPSALAELIRAMDREGYAACGMPDGGVVRIRYHNPVGCNAFFNIFDLRRVRPIWQDWPRVLRAAWRPEYERLAPTFARRTPYAFDDFQRYYSVFFALLEAGERIMYLDAEEWQDGVSTLLKGLEETPLLIHCWYTRNWETSYHTRRRYQSAIQFARQTQLSAPADCPRPVGSCAPADRAARAYSFS